MTRAGVVGSDVLLLGNLGLVIRHLRWKRDVLKLIYKNHIQQPVVFLAQCGYSLLPLHIYNKGFFFFFFFKSQFMVGQKEVCFLVTALVTYIDSLAFL